MDSKEHLSDEGAARVRVVPTGTLLVSFKLSLGRLAFAGRDLRTNEAIAALCELDERAVSKEYLYWFLTNFDWQGAAEGEDKIKGKTLNKGKLEQIEILYPPLPEQQRIVAFLDKAFEEIDAAIALVEAQRHYDRELRASALAAHLPKSGTVVTLADHVDMLVGFAFKSTDYVSSPEAVRLLRGDNITPSAIRWDDAKALPRDKAADFSRYSLAVDDIVVAMDRPWIKAGLKQARLTAQDVPSLLVQRVARLRCRSSLKVSYLQHLIASSLFEAHVLDQAGGSGVPHISGGQLGAFSFVLPTLEEQASIVERLDSLEVLLASLAGIRTQKLAALAELKQALLARAFSGELAAANDNAFATPEHSANVIAYLYWRHERAQRNLSYRRVKAQKALDLVERIGGVELGRSPYKDAAGPNDLAHMNEAQTWAKANAFFEFVRRGEGYDFKPLARYSERLSAAQAALKPITSQLDRVADILLPKDKEESEVFATVLAAWNNLIADGQDASDASILKEARDDWHADKLQIAVSKFTDAIREIRRLDLVPDGTAKVVRHRQAKLL